MATRRRTGNTLATKTAELAFATPQVMAHRLTRMALAGPTLSERDRKEFHLMGMEKLGAFTAAWQQMALASVTSSQRLAIQMWTAWWAPWLGGRRTHALNRQLQHAATSVLGKGLAPIHAKATANARRLGSTPLIEPPKRRTRAK